VSSSDCWQENPAEHSVVIQ